jgi:hypothetical protein
VLSLLQVRESFIESRAVSSPALPSNFVAWPPSQLFLFHAFTTNFPHLSYLTTHRGRWFSLLHHKRRLLIKTFVLCAENNRTDGNITLEGSFLTPLPRDARRYLDGEACYTDASSHTALSTPWIISWPKLSLAWVRQATARNSPCRPLIKQPTDQYYTLVQSSALYANYIGV